MAFCKMLIRTGHRRNQPAASTKDLERTALCFAADQINDSVRVPDFFLKALGPVVNHRVCAEVAHEGDIIRGCGCDRLHARAAGQLNRIRSNVSCRAVNDYRLTCFELGLIEQRLPCRHGNDRNRGSFNVGKRGRLARDHRCGSQRILGIGPNKLGICHTIDLLSHTQLRNPWPHGGDFTRQIRAQSEGERLRQRALSGSNPAVPWTDPSGFNFDKHLARAGLGPENAVEPHDLWWPELVHAPGHHC
jgi:hypothetical protein